MGPTDNWGSFLNLGQTMSVEGVKLRGMAELWVEDFPLSQSHKGAEPQTQMPFRPL
jgi:hypothetical protein